MATATILLALVSGCGGFLAGSMAENIENVAPGTNAETGSMLIRNAFVLGSPRDATIPQGGRAAVYLTLFNRGTDAGPSGTTDRLIGASAGKAARSVRLSGGSIPVPPEQLVNVTLDEGALVLRNLTEPLTSGSSVQLTLRFERNGSVTLHVPVLPRTGSYATLSPFPASPSPGLAGTPSPTVSVESPTPGSDGTATPASPRERATVSPTG